MADHEGCGDCGHKALKGHMGVDMFAGGDRVDSSVVAMPGARVC